MSLKKGCVFFWQFKLFDVSTKLGIIINIQTNISNKKKQR